MRAPADVLVSGVEREPWTPSQRLQEALVPVALLAATVGVTAALVQAQRAEDARDLAARAAERSLRTELRLEDRTTGTPSGRTPRCRGSAPAAAAW